MQTSPTALGLLSGLLLMLITAGLFAADDQMTAPLKEFPDRPEAPDFSLADLEGNIHSLSDYRGKTLAVHFWSVYCPHCRHEVASLEEVWMMREQEKQEGINPTIDYFIAINWGESEKKIKEFSEGLARSGKSLGEYDDVVVLLDPDKDVAKSWKVRGLPATYIIDGEGRMVALALGERDWTAPSIGGQIDGFFSE